jgi:hypothetical protein
MKIKKWPAYVLAALTATIAFAADRSLLLMFPTRIRERPDLARRTSFRRD